MITNQISLRVLPTLLIASNTRANAMATRAYLFDVDGVLYDSMPQHARSWVKAFREKGLRLPAKFVYECEGMPEASAVKYLASAIKQKPTRRTLMTIVERKREIYNNYQKPKFIRGARSLIRYLQKEKCRICLVTGSYQEKTIKNLQKDFNLRRSDILTGKEVRHGKPHPEPYLKALKKLRLSAHEAIVIENAPLGIESAKRAGIACIALTTGLLSRRELQKHGADTVLKDCAELLEKIKGDFYKIDLTL